MHITKIQIKNFKSLRDVELRPASLSIIIGPNGSGKSNLASAFDFVAELYQNGLEYAIAKKGGFENIAFRRLRRTKAPLEFCIEASLNRREAARALRHSAFRDLREESKQKAGLLVRHSFSFRAARQSIRSDYLIESESLHLEVIGKESGDVGLFEQHSPSIELTLFREGNRVRVRANNDEVRRRVSEYLDFYNEYISEEEAFDLFLRRMFQPISSLLGGISVHQFSPQICRSAGSPSPQPRLTSYGQNLPSLVDWLRRHHPDRWRSVESAMRDILPDLEEISVEYLHTKQLGLFFKERTFGRPWPAEDMSDGTIQTLAILSALADPRNLLVVIEEPENSIHPWIVKQIASHLRRVSKLTQVIATTHSPLVLNVVEPDAVWVCYKSAGATKLAPLVKLSPQTVADWNQGVDRLFELLDTGSVPEAVPLSQG